MRLLFVLNSSQYFVLNRIELAKAAQAAGYAVSVAAVADDADSVEAIREAGMEFYDLHLERQGFNPLSALNSTAQLRKIFQRVQPDIVHSWTIKGIILSGILCRLMDIPMLALIAGRGHSFDGAVWLRNLAKVLYRVALGGVRTQVVFQNDADQQFFQDSGLVPAERCRVIPGSGVNLERFAFSPYAVDKKQRVVLLASRMLRQKGIVDFLEAAQRVRKQYPETVFRLVGAPDPGNPHSFSEFELYQLSEEAGVEYCGFSRDMVATLAACDIYCLPTYYREGIPMTLMQAMAMGRPVVTTAVSGCSDVVEDGQTGLLVPPRHPEHLAEAICHLLASESLAVNLAKQAHQRLATQFSSAVINTQYLGLYRSMEKTGVFPCYQEERG